MKTEEEFFNYLLELNEISKANYLFDRMFLFCDNENDN